MYPGDSVHRFSRFLWTGARHLSGAPETCEIFYSKTYFNKLVCLLFFSLSTPSKKKKFTSKMHCKNLLEFTSIRKQFHRLSRQKYNFRTVNANLYLFSRHFLPTKNNDMFYTILFFIIRCNVDYSRSTIGNTKNVNNFFANYPILLRIQHTIWNNIDCIHCLTIQFINNTYKSFSILRRFI